MNTAIDNDELECWLNCYGEPLSIGLIVRTTQECELEELKGHELVVTSLGFDSDGVCIGVNGGSDNSNLDVEYDGLRIDHLQTVRCGA